MQKHMDTTITRLEQGLGAWQKVRGFKCLLNLFFRLGQGLTSSHRFVFEFGSFVCMGFGHFFRVSQTAYDSLACLQGNPGHSLSANYVYDKPS